MSVLITALSDWDPYAPATAAAGPLAGPILRLLAQRRYPAILLAYPTDREAAATELRDTIAQRSPASTIALVPASREGDVRSALNVARENGWANKGGLIEILPAETLDEKLWSHAAISMGLRPLLLRVHSGAPGEDDLIETISMDSAQPRLLREPRPAYGTLELVEDPVGSLQPEASGRDPRGVARSLGLIGEDPAFVELCGQAAAVAPHNVPLLILGETGTGKGLLARYIHELSPRARGPFVAVNCSALPEQIVESLLFGHVKGAFTGAGTDQPGRFLLADGGTLFLDEVGELPLSIQPKILRVLEDGRVEPLGATKPRRVDVRIIAATHRDVRTAVRDGTFREDLYFRLAFATLTMPALRERRSDIQALALHALQRINRRLRTPKQLAGPALRKLEQQPWRGNIRELENTIGRSALITPGNSIGVDDLLIDGPGRPQDGRLPEPHEGFSLEEYLSDTRRALIDKALELTHGRQAAAARLLGISPQAVGKYVQQRATDNRN